MWYAAGDNVSLVHALGGYKSSLRPFDGRQFYYAACDSGGVECVFEPRSPCHAALVDELVALRNSVGARVGAKTTEPARRYAYPARVPDERPYEAVPPFDERGTFWFVASLVGLHWRPTPPVQRAVQRRRAQLFGPPRGAQRDDETTTTTTTSHAYLGVQVRHGDSCARGYVARLDGELLDGELLGHERFCFALESYAAAIVALTSRYALHDVFVATDDPKAVDALRRILPRHLRVLAQDAPVSSALESNVRIEERMARAPREVVQNATEEVLTDIEILADASVLVGTFTSQIFRLAFELSFFRKQRIVPYDSLDIAWCWGGFSPVNVTLSDGRDSLYNC